MGRTLRIAAERTMVGTCILYFCRYCSYLQIIEIEQFDEALDRRVWSLSDQRRRWDLEVATKRRTTPQEIEKGMKDLIVHQNEYEDVFSDEESNMNDDYESSDSQ